MAELDRRNFLDPRSRFAGTHGQHASTLTDLCAS
jgi:hypothetical protein